MRQSEKAEYQLQCFETQLCLLLEDYADEPARIPHVKLAQALGKAFGEQLLRVYGYRGLEYANGGISAILSALKEINTPHLPPATTSAQEHI